MNIEECIFIGIVSAYGSEANTVIVTRPDKDDRTTAPLQVIQQFAQDNKSWRMPAIGEQVFCVMLPNTSGNGPGAGVCLGAVYSETDTPPETDNAVRAVHYQDGSYIKEDGKGNIEIHAAGDLTITTGGNVYIN